MCFRKTHHELWKRMSTSTYGNDVELQRQSAGRKRDNCALSAISLTTRAQQQCNCAPVFQFLLCCAERNSWFASSSIPHKTVRTFFFYQTFKTVFKFGQNLILGLISAKIHICWALAVHVKKLEIFVLPTIYFTLVKSVTLLCIQHSCLLILYTPCSVVIN